MRRGGRQNSQSRIVGHCGILLSGIARKLLILSTAARDVPAAGKLAPAASPELRKHLGFVDLIFACVLMVVIPDFFVTAVKAGSASVCLWLLALTVFFVPQALVVRHLNKRLPLEGGLYEWARLAFGDFIGFVVAWNLWLYVVVYTASIGLVTMNYLAYVLGSEYAWIATNRPALIAATVGIIAGLMLVAHVGWRMCT